MLRKQIAFLLDQLGSQMAAAENNEKVEKTPREAGDCERYELLDRMAFSFNVKKYSTMNRFSRPAIRIAALVVSLAAASNACAQTQRVELKTSMGSFTLELYPDKAPKTVANFLQYAKSGFYDGTIFHRVIDGFMIQGGGFEPGLREKSAGAPIPNEAGIAFKAGLRNEMGTIAMARTPNPHSATAQFFINVKNNDFLNFREESPQGYGYAVFGRVVEGMSTVMRIAKTPTTTSGQHQNVPQVAVRIESVTVKPTK